MARKTPVDDMRGELAKRALQNQLRNQLVLRVSAGELTTEQADQESLRQGAGRIFHHSIELEKADFARAVWRDAFGDARPLSGADAGQLGQSLSFLQGLSEADLLHTPKGAERKALADLLHVRDRADSMLNLLSLTMSAEDGAGQLGLKWTAVDGQGRKTEHKTILRDTLTVRWLSRNLDTLSFVEKLMEARSAAGKAIEGYEKSEPLQTIGESTKDRVVHRLADLFERYSGERASVPLSENKDPDWSFVRFVYSAVRWFEIPYALRQGGRPGRKPKKIARRPNQPDELPGLSFSTIFAALNKRRKRTAVWDRELRRAARNSAKGVPTSDDEQGD
jgi:hypothetical protein